MKLAISVGELSADEHAAEVVAALKSQIPNLEVRGMGGRNLRAQGVDTFIDSESEASVMGFKELFGSFRKVIRAFKEMESLLKEWKPDALLVLDYADFNMRLASKAKKIGVPVIYYIPPQMWAWREKRVETMKLNVSRAALIFPFEKDFYSLRGYQNTRYVGHPFFSRLKDQSVKRATVRKVLGYKDQDKVLVIFPGSRTSEIEKHVDVIKETINILRGKHDDIVPVIGVASSLSEKAEAVLQNLKTSEGIELYNGDSFDLLCAGDAGIIKSGTSNLQAAFAHLPFVMIYKASIVSELIARIVVPTRTFSIVNVIRERTVPELVQRDCNPKNLALECEKLLYDSLKKREMLNAFEEIINLLSTFEDVPEFVGTNAPAERVARMILNVRR